MLTNLGVACVIMLVMTLTACFGSSSSTDSPISSNPATSASSLTATITDVSIPDSGGTPTVSFTITDANGNGVTGLTGMRYIIAKLVASADGEPSYWQSYINTTATKEAGDPGTTKDGTTAVQATTENDSSEEGAGVLTEKGGGQYEYVFATDLSAVTTENGKALDVPYEPELTHRVAMQISATNDDGETIWANPIYDFQPSTGDTTGITTRDMALTSSCNECHDDLAMHGGGRHEVKYCVTCHNPGTVDPNTGNNLDMALMVHKIHRGASLPSVADGGEDYEIYGYHDTEHDYSTVVFPQDIRHCEKCHNPSDEETPDASNYAEVPYIRACEACHDDIVFDGNTPEDWQVAHSGGTATNAECATCHGGSGATVDGRIAGVHVIATEVAAANFQYNILSVKNTDPGEFPKVKFSVTNPLTDETYDVKSDPQWTGSGSINIKIAWNTLDYNNTDSESGDEGDPAQPVSLNGETATANGDGTFTITSDIAIPAGAEGSGVVMIDGRPSEALDDDGLYDDRIPVTNAVKYFKITDDETVERREVVSMDKCNNCHGFLSLHGSNRNNKIEACVICHNPNATDIVVRPAMTDDDEDDVPDDFDATGTDGKREESIDFKYMIHAIHAGSSEEHGYREAGIVVYGYGGRAHDYSEVRFPGSLNNCNMCHTEDTYLLPMEDDILATTIGTGDVFADLADPDVDENISPMSSVCSSCHDSALAQTHMEQNGGEFDSTQAVITANASETCAICHGDGKTADVNTVHGITE